MTAAKLEELEAKATEGPWYCGRIDPSSAAGDFSEPWSPWVYPNGPRCVTVGRSQAIHADDMALITYLRNHAQDFIRLMEAAENFEYSRKEYTYNHQETIGAANKLSEALAAFKEKS
jgi:hypothetical protein